MNRSLGIALAVVALIAVISVGAFLYLTREVAAPSTDVNAVVESVATSEAAGGEQVFAITQDGTTAEFSLYELLNGQDKTVIGTTNEVGGEIAINLSDLSLSRVGELRINARTFQTDEDRRDNAIARFILQSEDAANEFIVFQPTAITGLSGSASADAPFTFQITGDLTIAGITQSTTFDVTAVLSAGNVLTGHAETLVSRADFNLNIPQVPMVANVGDEVTLKLDFTAAAA